MTTLITAAKETNPREDLAICKAICFTVRVSVRVDANPNPNLKTALKKKQTKKNDRLPGRRLPRPLVLLTPV